MRLCRYSRFMVERPRTSKGGKKRPPVARTRATRSALGNDPFERGAAGSASSAPGVLSPSEQEDSAPAPVQEAPEVPARVSAQQVSPDPESPIERLISARAHLRDPALREASIEHARDLIETVTGLVPTAKRSLRAIFAGSADLDAHGMDRDFAARARPLLEFLYSSWWRVEPREIAHVPAEGPVILVANQGGALPWDALMLRHALAHDHPAHRDLRPLLDEHAFKLPIAGTVAARLGAVAASPDHALGLLGQGLAVAVFPEGTRNGQRPWPKRYRVERFGRGGFAKLALRVGAPIVPCAIVGSEEVSAPFARPGWFAERLGLPFLASSPALPLAAVGMLPLPSRWSIRFGEAIDVRASAPDDQVAILELTERARASLQHMLDEDVAARRSVYL